MTFSNTNVPRDRATLNAWFRAQYLTNPKHHKQVGEYRELIIDHIGRNVLSKDDITKIVDDILVVGEVFFSLTRAAPYHVIKIYDGDYITVKRSMEAGSNIFFRQPEKNIPISGEFYHIANLPSPYDIRGESIFMQHAKDIASGEDFSIIPDGNLSRTVFENRCMRYAALINDCFTNITFGKESKLKLPVNITRVK